MLFKLVQYSKHPTGIYVMELGSLISFSLVQDANAYWSMRVTVAGIVTEVRFVQPEKVDLLMVVIPFGIVIFVREEQPSKAL